MGDFFLKVPNIFFHCKPLKSRLFLLDDEEDKEGTGFSCILKLELLLLQVLLSESDPTPGFSNTPLGDSLSDFVPAFKKKNLYPKRTPFFY